MNLRRSFWVVVATALLATLAPIGSASAQTVPPTPAGKTPFDSLTSFCTRSPVPSGKRNSSSPGVTPDSIVITDFSLDTDLLRRLGSDQIDFHGYFTAFWNEINRCGGINGRKVIFKKALYNPIAPDQAGHLQANCLKITEDQKAFLVLGITSNFSNRCTSVLHKTISVASAYSTSADFADSKGRIVSQYPAVDRLALSYIKDAAAQGLFKGRKIGVIGPVLTATSASDHIEQFVEPLKDVGVTPQLEMLPCVGTTCTSGMAAAVSRLKSNGVDTLIISPHFGVTAMGPLFREIYNQQYKVKLTGPDTNSLHLDSALSTARAGAGNDAMAYIDRIGWTSVGAEPRGGWRTGRTKASAFADMCNATGARLMKAREFKYVEADLVNPRWGAVVNICTQVREVSRALYSLGANVTTERMVNALRALTAADVKQDTSPPARVKWLYMERDVTPTQVTTNEMHFPCPLPTRSPTQGCMLPQDSPPRIRTVKL